MSKASVHLLQAGVLQHSLQHLNALQFCFFKCQALKKTGKEGGNKDTLIVQEGSLSSPFTYLFEDYKSSFFCQMIVFLLPLDGISELFRYLPSQRTLVRGKEHKHLIPKSPSMRSLSSVVEVLVLCE